MIDLLEIVDGWSLKVSSPFIFKGIVTSIEKRYSFLKILSTECLERENQKGFGWRLLTLAGFWPSKYGPEGSGLKPLGVACRVMGIDDGLLLSGMTALFCHPE